MGVTEPEWTGTLAAAAPEEGRIGRIVAAAFKYATLQRQLKEAVGGRSFAVNSLNRPHSDKS